MHQEKAKERLIILEKKLVEAEEQLEKFEREFDGDEKSIQLIVSWQEKTSNILDELSNILKDLD